MLLSAVYVLVVAQSSSEVPEGLMNNPVFSRPLSYVIVETMYSTVFAKREHSVMNKNRKLAQNVAIATVLSKKVTSAKLLLNRTKSFSNESHDKLDF